MNFNDLKSGYAFKVFGLTEQQIVAHVNSVLDERLAGLLDVSVDCLDGRIAISDAATLQEKRDIIYHLFSRLAPYVYSEINEELSYRALRLLTQRGVRLGVAESLTGGLLVAEIIRHPGASKVVSEGIVAYSNEAKQLRLDVYPDILNSFGAVSAETAAAMVNGLLSRPYNDVAISTTGFADATDVYTPAGLVYVGVGSSDRVEVHKYNFEGTRDEVRRCAVNAGLFQLVKLLKGDFHPEDYQENN